MLVWFSGQAVLRRQQCVMTPESQNSRIREMSQRCPLLGNIKHQLSAAMYVHYDQPLMAIYTHNSRTAGDSVFPQSATKQYTESLQANRRVCIIRSSKGVPVIKASKELAKNDIMEQQ
jgi:hypothetical protein